MLFDSFISTRVHTFQKHILSTNSSSHHINVKRLFHRANDLTQKHKLTIKIYKTHQHSNIARIKQAQVLHNKYRLRFVVRVR